MKKNLLLLFALILLLFDTGLVYAQTISSTTYPFTKTTTYSSATEPMNQPGNVSNPGTLLIASGTDEGASSLTDIGFDFWFAGTVYTQFSVESNGLIKLGSPVVTPEPNNNLASTTNYPILTPYWDNLITEGTQVLYRLYGTAPNRKLVIQYAPAPTGGFGKVIQAWLWENGKIEFAYSSVAIVANPNGYSIGIGSGSTFASITVASLASNSTVAYNVANNANTIAGPIKIRYSFTPTKPAAPTNLTFANVSGDGMQLNWTDVAPNETGYAIYKSTDNVNFEFVAQIAANSTSYTASGLNSGSLYFWKVHSVDAIPSDALTGSKATIGTPMSGTYKVGPTGDFNSLGAALGTLAGSGFSGSSSVIFELQTTYSGAVETYPLVFASYLPTNSTNTLTIRPETGATGLLLSSNAAQTISLDGAQYITIDGRPGGAGTNPELKIDNTLVTGNALLLNNIASNNSFLYCELTGVNTSASSGVVVLGTTTPAGTVGNSNNLIDYCNIHDGATKPAVLLVSNGTAGKLNENNKISNCNFYNWNISTYTSRGLSIGGNTSGMLITGNSFYQTAATTGISGTQPSAFIGISGSTTTNNITVSNNFLGGTAPLCGGTPMTVYATTYYDLLYGIYIVSGNTAATNIQGNTIQNIQFISNSGAGGSFYGIVQVTGWVNIGTVAPNIIGSQTLPNSITITSNSSSMGASFYGISISSTTSADQTTISNNVISGVSMTNTALSGVSFVGISAGAYYTLNMIVTGNTIGSTSMANAINNSTPGTITGISAPGKNNNIITGNTVANLTQTNSAATGNQLIGLAAPGSPAGIFNVSNNTIYNLSSASTSTGAGSTSSVIGLSVTATTAGQIISQNRIYGLSNTNPTAATSVTGLYYAGATTGTNVVSRNFIQGLTLASSATAASIHGIYVNAGLTSFQNNMVQMGIDASGAEINTGYNINGIFDAAGTSNYYNNSVYIGGSGVAGTTSNTFAFKSAVLTGTRAFQNNIFVNARSGGSTGKHYAITVGGTSVNPAGLNSSNNVLFAPGATGGNIGLYNGLDQLTLTDWQNATGQDILSAATDPMFVNPIGNSSTLDLHVQASNPIEGSGLLIASVTDDYDGQDRTTLTPTDIGADAGNFTNSGDLFPPNISYVPFVNTTSTANLPLSVIITDGVGVSSGANQPRLYFKKATDANVFAGNTSTDNGWKYVHPANATSPYDFTIDYSIINGGSITPGDVVQYFVVAQDDVNNFASKAAGATASSITNPVQNINGAPNSANLNGYIIINNNFAGTVTVPGNYPNLTGENGLFNAMNIGTVTGNINVVITDNMVEPGTHALNDFASPFTLTMTPGSASLKTISGNIDNGLIRFNGTDSVTIDGRFGGTGKYLEFANISTGTSSTNSAFLFVNGATYNTIQYTSAKAQAPSGAVISFYAISPNTGNNSYNTIDHCDISNSGSGNLQMGVYSYYNSFGGQHVFNTISNCNISDFFHATNSAWGIYLAIGNSDWTITGNSFYQSAPRPMPYATYGIMVSGTNGSNFNISNNYIGGSAPNAGGTPWTISSGNASFYGMYFLTNTTTPALNATVTNNTITNLDITNSNNYQGFKGIYLSSYATSGLFTFSGNTIGSSSSTDAIVLRGGTSGTSGIEKIGTGTSVNCINNTISGITTTAGFYGINLSGGTTAAQLATHSIDGNIIGSASVANSIKVGNTTTAASAIGIYNTSYKAYSVSNNTIANITNLYEGTLTTGTIKGLYFAGSGAATVNGNTIFNLISKSAQVGTAALGTASVIGIHKISLTAACSISQNLIYGLENKSVTGVVNVAGISITSASGSVTAERNSIYGLSLSTSATTASMTGIYAGGGLSNFQNNVINLGKDVSGADITTGYAINGIHNNGGTNYYYFNTLYISGSNVAGTTSSTYGLNGTTSANILQNNIFINTRSGGTTGLHYALKLASAPTTLDNNDYFVSGGTGFLSAFGATNYTDFATWKSTAVAGKDLASLNVNPLFLTSSDLTPTNSSLAGAGVAAGTTIDYLGTTRSASPTIGAYETIGICTSPAPADAGPITGSVAIFQGVAATMAYSIAPVANSTYYVWSYSGTGATIYGTGTNVTIDFATDATEGTLSVKGTNTCSEGLASTVDIKIYKALNLKVMLQGLWNPTNSNMNMSKMADGITPNFTGTVADTLSVELHDSASYVTIVYHSHDLELNQDGTVNTSGSSYIQIPTTMSGSYFITIKTRNHTETTSAAAVSFAGSIIDYDFSTDATQAYGSNEVLLSTGIYGLYVADVNKDGIVNATDRDLLLIDLNAAVLGYIVNDINSDGAVNATDRDLLLINLNNGVIKQTP